MSAFEDAVREVVRAEMSAVLKLALAHWPLGGVQPVAAGYAPAPRSKHARKPTRKPREVETGSPAAAQHALKTGDRVRYRQGRGEFAATVRTLLVGDLVDVERDLDGKHVTRPESKLCAA